MKRHEGCLLLLLLVVAGSVAQAYYVPGTYPQEFLTNAPLSGGGRGGGRQLLESATRSQLRAKRASTPADLSAWPALI